MCYLAYTNNSESLDNLFNYCIGDIFHGPSEGKRDKRYSSAPLAQFILRDMASFQPLFLMLNIRVKTVVIEYMINDKEFSQGWHNIFASLNEEDFLLLGLWTIVNCKKSMFDTFNYSKVEENAVNLIFFLKQVSKLLLLEREEKEKEECLSII
jgi:hypothetical protein